jgi:hypothetical protein
LRNFNPTLKRGQRPVSSEISNHDALLRMHLESAVHENKKVSRGLGQTLPYGNV